MQRSRFDLQCLILIIRCLIRFLGFSFLLVSSIVFVRQPCGFNEAENNFIYQSVSIRKSKAMKFK